MAISGSDPSVFAALEAAGLAGLDTRRVVIDITAGEVIRVYIERYGDESILRVIEATSSVKVERH